MSFIKIFNSIIILAIILIFNLNSTFAENDNDVPDIGTVEIETDLNGNDLKESDIFINYFYEGSKINAGFYLFEDTGYKSKTNVAAGTLILESAECYFSDDYNIEVEPKTLKVEKDKIAKINVKVIDKNTSPKPTEEIKDENNNENKNKNQESNRSSILDFIDIIILLIFLIIIGLVYIIRKRKL